MNGIFNARKLPAWLAGSKQTCMNVGKPRRGAERRAGLAPSWRDWLSGFQPPPGPCRCREAPSSAQRSPPHTTPAAPAAASPAAAAAAHAAHAAAAHICGL